MGRLKTPSLSHIAAASLAFSLAGSPMVFAQDAQQDPVTQAEEAVVSANDAAVETPVIAAPPLQVTNSYHLDPLLPISAIAGMALLYAAFGVYPFRRRIGGAFLRAAAGATITVLMLNPEITTETREALPTEVLVVVDSSASQRFGTRAAETAAAYEDVMRQLSGLDNITIRTVEIDGRDADGQLMDGTQLFSNITERLSDVPRDQLGAIFVITDGIIHDVPENYNAADNEVPIHTLITGQNGEFDRRIELVQVPQFGLPDTAQTISFKVTDSGAFPTGITGPVTVTVSANGEVIDEYEARPGEIVEAELPVGHVGANVYTLSVGTVAGELTPVNNTISTSIEGVREDFNVLLLSGSPENSSRVLRDVLRSDPGTNLVHLTILRPLHKPQNVPLREVSLIAVPTQEILQDRINDFDLIVFDRFGMDPNLVNSTYLRNIAEFVRNGGSLLVISSDEFISPYESISSSSILREILPVTSEGGRVEEGGFRPQVQGDGLRHPVTRDLPESGVDGEDPEWGMWLRRVTGEVAEDANVLLYGPNDEPLLVLSRVGEGRIATLMSDNFWLWGRGYDGGGPDAELLQRVAHWLMAYPELEEENLRLNISQDGTSLIVTRQTLSEEVDAPVVITSPTGEVIEVVLEETDAGIYQGRIDIDELGFYRAEHTGGLQADSEDGEERHLSSFTSVGPANPVEFQETISTEDRLAPLFEGRAGTVLRVAQTQTADEVTVNVPSIELQDAASGDFSNPETLGVRKGESFILKDASDNPLIPGWLGMSLALACFGGAWYREGGGKNPLKRKSTPKP